MGSESRQAGCVLIPVYCIVLFFGQSVSDLSLVLRSQNGVSQ